MLKKALKKFLDDLKPNSEYSKWLDERVEAMEAQEKAEENKAVDEDIEYSEKKYAEAAEQETELNTEVETEHTA